MTAAAALFASFGLQLLEVGRLRRRPYNLQQQTAVFLDTQVGHRGRLGAVLKLPSSHAEQLLAAAIRIAQLGPWLEQERTCCLPDAFNASLQASACRQSGLSTGGSLLMYVPGNTVYPLAEYLSGRSRRTMGTPDRCWRYHCDNIWWCPALPLGILSLQP